MTLLRFKAIVYKYTGVYLAHKEQCEYMNSDSYWKNMAQITKKNKDMGAKETNGLLIGMWQADYGFVRPGSFLKFKRPRVLWSIIGWFADLFIVLKWDAIRLCRGIFPLKADKPRKRRKKNL
jgi:hypothetical protein